MSMDKTDTDLANEIREELVAHGYTLEEMLAVLRKIAAALDEGGPKSRLQDHA